MAKGRGTIKRKKIKNIYFSTCQPKRQKKRKLPKRMQIKQHKPTEIFTKMILLSFKISLCKQDY